MNIFETNPTQDEQAKRDKSFNDLLAELAADREAQGGKPRRVFKDRFVNSNVSGGGL